jgi:anthranilate/para-aminobenzoate synthase component I
MTNHRTTLLFTSFHNVGSVSLPQPSLSSILSSKIPTAAFFLDHHPTQQWYLIGVARINKNNATTLASDEANILKRMKNTRQQYQELDDKNNKERQQQEQETTSLDNNNNNNNNNKHPNRSPRCTNTCHEQISLGESYELCLTNQLEASIINPVHVPRSGPLDCTRYYENTNRLHMPPFSIGI